MQSISLHELHNLYFQFSGGSSSSTSSASNDMVFRSATANAGFLNCREVRDAFCSIFNDTQQAIPVLEDFSFLTVCRKAVSHIFADICTPRARLQKPLSKDGFPTLEYPPKPLAGHPKPLAGHPKPLAGHQKPLAGHPKPLAGLAKIVTGGRTLKSKPSLPHARTQPATRALHERLAPGRCVERRAAQKDARRARRGRQRRRGRRRGQTRPTAQPTGGGGGRQSRAG